MLVNVLLFVVLVLWTSALHVGSAAAAGSELPPGLQKGAEFQIAISSGGGIFPETLRVIETKGTWVHAEVVRSQLWKGDVWVNLAATDFGYVNVVGNPTPPK